MSLFQLIYVSRSSRVMDDAALHAIQQTAVRVNDERSITGVLLYAAGNFMQVLEGDPARIAELYASICGDPRHTRMQCIFFGPVPARMFPGWSMGVFDMDKLAVTLNRTRLSALISSHYEDVTRPIAYDDLVALLDVFVEETEAQAATCA